MNLDEILRNPPMKNNYIGDGKNYKEIDYDKWKQQIKKLMLGEEIIEKIVDRFLEYSYETQDGIEPKEIAKTISQKQKDKLK